MTIDGIDLTDNPANTTNPSTMEYGYALYRASTTNGCQNITIRNCKIKLNRDNNATGTTPMTDGCSGIIMMNATANAATTALTIVSVAGANSNNKFYGNTISNCNVGMSLIGYASSSPYTLGDANNDIGGATAATANTILNFGGGAGALNTSSGIRMAYQYGLMYQTTSLIVMTVMA